MSYVLWFLIAFTASLLALYVKDWLDEKNFSIDFEFDWIRALPAELLFGMAAVVLIMFDFAIVVFVIDDIMSGYWLWAILEAIITAMVGLFSIFAFVLAARRWLRNWAGRLAWTPFVLAFAWILTAAYLISVVVGAVYTGNWPWGVFNALGAFASALFALPLIVAVFWAKRAQRKLAQ